jgi:hypothetical protein
MRKQLPCQTRFCQSLLKSFLFNTTQNIGPGNSAINGGGMYLGKASATTFNGVTVDSNKLSGNMGKGKGIAYENGAAMNGLPAGLTDNDDPGGNPVQV